MSEPVKLRETMWATMQPDCYGGATCDQVLPRWSVYAAGDKEGEDGLRVLTLNPRTFPPGTTVVISEPLCPKCGEGRSTKWPPPKRGPMFEPKCECGFDWDEWTEGQYS